jgi:major membrane immunogen (membrane-anchored lipoprotein)
VKVIQNKLNNTSLKAFEAETVVERVLDLTNKLVASIKNEDINSSIPLNELGDQLMMPLSEDPTSELSWQQKRLENVLELTKENLKTKEMEVLAAQRALTIKDEELKMTLARLDAKEEELRKAKDMATEDANDHKMVYAMTQERIGEKTMDDLAIEKLQLEAAQLEDEVEAATSTLQKLAEMSQQLLNKAMPSVEADSYISLMQNNNDINLNSITNINCIDCLAVVKAGVARLSALTEQLVMDAGLAAAS